MVKPVDFCYNEETARDNEFMHKLSLSRPEIRARAINEFEGLVQKVRDAGVEVLVFDKDEHSEMRGVFTPDSVFPNNWISTESNNLVYTFSMYAPNRRDERKALPIVEKMFIDNGFSLRGIVQVGSEYRTTRDEFLEGTGSMIIDRVNNMVYACRSRRTCDKSFKNFLELSGYKGILFDTQSASGTPYYHTNMMLSIGQKYASVCLEAIVEEQRSAIVDSLKAAGKEIIALTLDQVDNCCGNILELKSKTTGDNVIVMSERAYKAYTADQRAALEKCGKIVYSNIDTIEEIGGGSARCMLCEVFLKKSKLPGSPAAIPQEI